jgi:hypothetical protein
MTDKDFDELEQLDAEERARLLSRRDTFVLSSEHLDIICNKLFSNDDDGNLKLGRILRDLVSFNIDGTTELIDGGDKNDRADLGARELLYGDCKRYIDKWLLTSLHNAKNRQGKTKASAEEQAQETDTQTDAGQPTLGDVLDYARGLTDQYNTPIGKLEMVARKWHEDHKKHHWRDDDGKPIKDWRSLLKRYLDGQWRTGKLQA